jgi:hypothetical protein
MHIDTPPSLSSANFIVVIVAVPSVPVISVTVQLSACLSFRMYDVRTPNLSSLVLLQQQQKLNA